MSSILDAIGNTPLAPLRRSVPGNGAELWLKLGYFNPTGSMKDRMALAMIEGAERDDRLSPGDTVVEYTSGSTGPSLALVCRAKGYRPLIVMADCFTKEAGHYATDQFNNPYIIPGHRDGLGRKIWEQTHGRVTALTQGIGTGGSLMGVSDTLKPHGVTIQGLEPAGSAALAGGAPGAFAMQGWAGSVVPQWDPARIDHVDPIGDDEGIFAGISTGANVAGAHRLAKRLGPDAVMSRLPSIPASGA